jgi:hypothetical protein
MPSLDGSEITLAQEAMYKTQRLILAPILQPRVSTRGGIAHSPLRQREHYRLFNCFFSRLICLYCFINNQSISTKTIGSIITKIQTLIAL